MRRPPAWYERRRRRYARLLRRAGLSPEAIARRLRRRCSARAVTPEMVAEWVRTVGPRRDVRTFDVLAEYRQVCDLRDRAYRMLIGGGAPVLDADVCRNVPQFYEKMLAWSLTLSGKGALLGLGRFGRRGVREMIERMVRQLGEILRELGVIHEGALAAHGDEITRRMLAAAPGWFEAAKEDRGR